MGLHIDAAKPNLSSIKYWEKLFLVLYFFTFLPLHNISYW